MSPNGYPINTKLDSYVCPRRTIPKVCATCKYFRNTDGFGNCMRVGSDGEPIITFDVEDMFHWMTTCHLWKENHVSRSHSQTI